jgi:RNA polymerase sigma-54 factor
MALAARLEIRQGQGLVITPQLQQAIKLLQLSNVELEAFVEAELEKNPLLQRDGAEGAAAAEADARDGDADAAGHDTDGGEMSGTDLDARAAGEIDARHEDLYGDASPGERDGGESGDARAESAPAGEANGAVDWSQAGRGGGAELTDDMEQALTRALTLTDHLEAQAALAGFDPAERAIASALIDAVDEGGYLRADLDEIAERLGCQMARLEGVLERLQGFEPVGVFARDVRECLALQLKDKNRFDPAMAALLDNLDLLARRDLAALRRACGVDEEDLKDMIAELRGLTPRPGAAFGGEPAAPITPDVFVREGEGGLWRVELNTDTLPRLLVDQRYHALVSGGARTDQDKVFVADCMAQASWLIKSLDQRAKTILKVASEIARQQDGFLAFGVEHLRPLNLKTVADAIGMHESTVSRVTSNKYIATPRGVFEMKFFFTSAIASSEGGEAHSAESVRHRIKQLIDAEAATDNVLSDDAIVDILKEAGVDIARRSVAKYREAMRIPSSVERRRLLRAAC